MRKRLGLIVAALAVAFVASGCQPSGRYFNEVFSSAVRTADIQYGAAPDENGVTERLLLDLYQPAGDQQARRPAIVWVHGGGFRSGSKANMAADAASFARRGYVTVTINYRLRDDNIGQAIADAQHDAQAAVRWLRRFADQYRVDVNRIAIGGSSAGAITALYVANHSEDPGTSGNPGFRSDVQVALSRSGFGGFYSAGDPPIALFHGTADGTVPYQTAVDTCRNHRAAGNVCQLTTYQGAGHGLYADHRDDIVAKSAAFLYEHLDLGP